jgi:anti-sigma factor RsiW
MNCEWRQKAALYVDDQLEPSAQEEFSAHARDCAECSAAMIDQMELKKSVRLAGRRFTAPPELRAAIRRNVSRADVRRPVWQWAAITASLLLLAVITLLLSSRWKQTDRMMAEVVDQHITTLASANPVDVVSTDRHTVKPWFQGRLPFSFNLPELTGSPFTLVGGKTVYLEQNPAAELLYEIRKHRISVFVLQARDDKNNAVAPELAFTVNAWTEGRLRFYLVTDASKDDAAQLVALFQQANR